MPKAAQYTLVWSPARQTYCLQISGEREAPGQFNDQAWLAWLVTQRAFAFHGQHGKINLLKESRKGGAGYWYAYQRQGKRTRKRYVGRDADLAFAHLEMITRALNGVALGNQPLPEPHASATPSATRQPAAPLLMPKLQLPRLHAALVARPRLLRQLDGALMRQLTLIIAPAGFGKTTLLRQWIAESDQLLPTAIAWLSLDMEDNDPVRFWRYVIEACQHIQPGLGEMALRLLSTMQLPFAPLPLETVLSTLLNALSEYTQPCLLVLEDYHLITADLIHTTLTFFWNICPPTFICSF
ncbi:MAG: hypothetical protein NT075_26800 [Chloroflexi bacterium]|nr:hypothetical protein [Chloroflexota bacterium]